MTELVLAEWDLEVVWEKVKASKVDVVVWAVPLQQAPAEIVFVQSVGITNPISGDSLVIKSSARNVVR
ncbi:MAG: hypothetical protein JXR87_07630 [Candidatus Marinimicrobia bacterium]|nr:hypothetical protein [Candidatus Neomarinimicrobiota bacterium]